MGNQIDEIIEKIDIKNSTVHLRTDKTTIQFGEHLPNDLLYFFEHYEEITLFNDSPYSIQIVGIDNFKKANPVILGEEIEEDRSNDWYIIAYGLNSQYVTIDLSEDKLGYCYDSFWDRHGVVGENPIIAQSFTELLRCLVDEGGQNYFWLEDNFKYLGDAYD